MWVDDGWMNGRVERRSMGRWVGDWEGRKKEGGSADGWVGGWERMTSGAVQDISSTVCVRGVLHAHMCVT